MEKLRALGILFLFIVAFSFGMGAVVAGVECGYPGSVYLGIALWGALPISFWRHWKTDSSFRREIKKAYKEAVQ